MEEQEKEFYSKLQVTRSIKFFVGKKSDKFIGLNKLKLTNNEKFSCDLTTILTRKKEVVAVNLTTHLDSCIINISKNSNWLQEDYQYINKIKECLIKISKYKPMTWEEAFTKHDTRVLIASVFTYCSERFESRLKKLKEDIKNGKNNQYIKSFLEYASISVNINDGKANPLIKSKVCCYYYKNISKNVNIPKDFLKHLRKVGSYMRSLISIISCACNEKYKVLFFNMDLNILKPIITHQPIFSWRNIIQKLIPNFIKYVDFKNAYLSNKIKADRLAIIYDGILECDFIKKDICLHAEMNILNEIINQKKKTRTYIAVSKKCCYLCELYIKFAQEQGYNIIISGAHRKIYNLWKLPSPTDIAFKSNFLSYALEELNRIIQEEVNSILEGLLPELPESDSNKSSINSDQIMLYDKEHNAKLDNVLESVFNFDMS
ncbi:hypothetical protein C1645_862060 [Glomus cerebriforme]|uniref:Uncharacterized protein n=1 Tax=Glomus cerebriforme TaxID=658196 RepID=A0A397TG13_9GLOM|nr:hypothetical protein C1645_862060 [Glomus cerebriforme]